MNDDSKIRIEKLEKQVGELTKGICLLVKSIDKLASQTGQLADNQNAINETIQILTNIIAENI